jgi:hypothetical protein
MLAIAFANYANVGVTFDADQPIGARAMADDTFAKLQQTLVVRPTPAPTLSTMQKTAGFMHNKWEQAFLQHLRIRGSCANWLQSFKCLGQATKDCKLILSCTQCILLTTSWTNRHALCNASDGTGRVMRTAVNNFFL